MEWEDLLIPPGIHTANNWSIEYGLAYDDTEDFFSASRYDYDNDINIEIIARNAWEDPIMDLYEWPDGFNTGSMYLEIEKEMVPLFARELEQLCGDMSVETMRQFFNGRYSVGVVYISVIYCRDDIRTNIVIYISDPHQFIREMQRLQGAPAFQYNTTDLLSFLDADESEVGA